MLDIMYEIPSEESVREVIVNEEFWSEKEASYSLSGGKSERLAPTCRACGTQQLVLTPPIHAHC